MVSIQLILIQLSSIISNLAYTRMKGRACKSRLLQKLSQLLFSISVITALDGPRSIVCSFQFQPIRCRVAKHTTSHYILRTSSSIESSSDTTVVEAQPQVLSGSVPLDVEVVVPSTMMNAFRIFFFTGDFGPFLVMISIFTVINIRIQMSPLVMSDGLVFAATVIFWSIQEHFLHAKVLHSTVNWVGKDIHQGHHEKPFYHISIESAPLLLGWMFAAHLVFRALLPLPLALTATVAYSSSGMFYEWAHFIVHTKVQFRSSFWRRVKENHVRHHMISDRYWFAFSMPFMDDIFNTNPSVRKVKRQLNEEKLKNEQQQDSRK